MHATKFLVKTPPVIVAVSYIRDQNLQWTLKKAQTVLKTIPFDVEALKLLDNAKGHEVTYHRLVAPDWANIVAVTQKKQVILIL